VAGCVRHQQSEGRASGGRFSEDGRIPLGGPVGDIDGDHTVLVVRATSENDARATFDDDPWTDSILKIESVEPWRSGSARTVCLPSRKLRPRVELPAALPVVEALARAAL
jgi:hypothetical protein